MKARQGGGAIEEGGLILLCMQCCECAGEWRW